MDLQSNDSDLRPRNRYYVAAGFTVSIAAYWALLSGASTPRSAAWINNITWMLVSAATAGLCVHSAGHLTGRERRSWLIVAGGCLLWFAGQCVWTYYEFRVGKLPVFPHWMQILFLAYPLALMIGMLTLPRPPQSKPLTVKRVGNLGLLICTLAVMLIITFTEPAAYAQRSTLNIAVSLAHGAMYPIACITALYLLWSYRWQTAHWPLLLIVVGLGFHTAAFFSDAHARMAGTYESAHWIQLAWLMSFAGTACAAHEFAWRNAHRQPPSLASLLERERWLEASMPALMILSMLAVGMLNLQWISPRVLVACAAVGVMFALLLGVREAWIQREEHRLLTELNASRDNLLAANEELKHSEREVRTLNTELERRVDERTAELQSAYRELESFSYAVAHDIKAPLRAINGFAALIAEESGGKLDSRSQSHLERVRRGALQMSQLVDDLLAYARVDRQALHAASTDVEAMIGECLAEHEDAIQRSGAQVAIEAEQVAVSADRAALALALRNLLQNALKFSRDARPPRIQIGVTRAGDNVRIAISDNGIGFDMQYHDQIFALFQRLHRADEYPGTGIGLALARKAVERMQGRLWAQSGPGQGATFFVELPVA